MQLNCCLFTRTFRFIFFVIFYFFMYAAAFTCADVGPTFGKGNSFCGLSIRTRISLPFRRHIKNVYTKVAPGQGMGIKENAQPRCRRRDKGKSLSFARLVRSLVSKMSLPERIAIIYGFLMRRQSAQRPTNEPDQRQSMYPLLYTYPYVWSFFLFLESAERTRKFGLRFHYSWI